MAKGTRVTRGQISAAHQLNDLIEDIREHTHGSGEGVINHGDLSDGAIGSGLSHAQLNTHIQGSGTSSNPDAIGGNQGVHGLPAGAFVAGCNTKGLVITSGQAVTDGSVSRGSWKNQTKTISFGVTYTAAPAVYVMPVLAEAGRIAVSSLTATGCVVSIGFGSTYYGQSVHAITFNWIAVGVRV